MNAANRALELSLDNEDPYLRAEALLSALFWQVICNGWNAVYFEECTKAIFELEKGAEPLALAQGKTKYAMLQFMSSQYREGLLSLDSGIPILASNGDVSFHAGQINRVWLLIFSGEWGKALEKVHTQIEFAVKEENVIRENMWRVQLAWIHQQALDYTHSAELCRQARIALLDPGVAAARRDCLILEGNAETNLGKLAQARKHLAEAALLQDHPRTLMDWYWKMPLYQAEIDLALQIGDVNKARHAAEKCLSASLATDEHTWRARAWEADARVANAEGDLARAKESIENAIAEMKEMDLPLAHWRVHVTAMMLIPENAEYHRMLAVETILRLASSLDGYPSLQDTFHSSPIFQNVLG